MKYIFIILGCLTVPTASYASDKTVNDIIGIWETGTASVEIRDCGDGTPCGKIVSMDIENAESATDVNNTDLKLQSRLLIGLDILSEYRSKGSGWKSGKIYYPKDGKTYKSHLKLNDEGNLKVSVCYGIFCQSVIWQSED